MALSPDGQQLAFRWRDRSREVSAVRLLPSVGGEARELVTLEAPEDIGPSIAWSRDGNHVLFGKRITNGKEMRTVLYRIPVDGGKAEALDVSIDGVVPKLAMHPDGRQLAFQATQHRGEVWVMENFLRNRNVSE